MAKKNDIELEKDIVSETQKQFSAITKRSGDESIRLGIDDDGDVKNIGVISTRSLSLDTALGVGGVPRGRIIEIFGPESSGKTTLALTIVAECQKAGGVAAFIDVEHAIDPEWCRTLGVNTKKLLFAQPDSAEDAFTLIKLLVNFRKVNLIVLDSVAALVTKAEMDGEVGDAHYAPVARIMSQELKKLQANAANANTCVIFINQIRDAIGSMIPGSTVPTGGRALRFYASQRLEIKRIAATKSGEEIIGSHVQVKVVKNKVAPPFKKAEFDIMYTSGISKSTDILEMGIRYKILERSGAWVTYNNQRLGCGVLKASEFLTQNPDMMLEIETKIKAIISQPTKLTEEDILGG